MNSQIDFAMIACADVLASEPSPAGRPEALAGWATPLTPHRYWNKPSHLKVIEEGGERLLAHASQHDDCLVTGDGFDADYVVEAEMAQLGRETTPNNDDRFGAVGKTGVFARYRTLRHYYQFCVERFDRLRLYRRADEDWDVLAERRMEIQPGGFHTLAMAVGGSQIRCLFDGQEVFSVADDMYSRGKAGWRTNTDSRVRRIEVRATPEAEADAAAARAVHESDVAAARRQYPEAVLWRRIPKGELTGTVCQFGHAADPTVWSILLCSPTATYTPDGKLEPIVALMNLNGDVLWRREMALRFPRLIDLNGDGRDEIVCFADDYLTILNGADGQVVAQTPLPEAERPDGTVGPLWPEFNGLAVADLRGVGRPSDMVLKEENHTGGHRLWAYDDELRPLWETTVGWPRYGHGIDFWDVNGDGRDEVLAGYDLLSADGEPIRRVRGAEEISPLGSCHADVVAVGPFGANGEMLAGICTGSDGFWLVDIATGEPIAKHRVGHAQGLSVAKFAAGVPGLQFLVGCRWDNYGVHNLFSCEGERLSTFEPDNVSQGGPPVNWTGDGAELFLLASTQPALGMYDCRGRKVVEFPSDLPEREYYGKIGGLPIVLDVTGDPRDEIIFNTDDAIYIYTQSPEPAPPERIYAPRRPIGNILPAKSVPDWVSSPVR